MAAIWAFPPVLMLLILAGTSHANLLNTIYESVNGSDGVLVLDKVPQRVACVQEKDDCEKLALEVKTAEKNLAVARMFAEQMSIKKQLEHFNESKDWRRLRTYLEEILEDDSAAYKQLQYIDYDEKWPMWYIGRNGYEELASVLVFGGQGFEAQDVDRGTILQGAAITGRVQMVDMLLDHGANIESESGAYCRTAILYAAEEYRPEVVKLLARRGANLDRANCDGETSLHLSALNGYLDQVQLLVELGGKTTLRNKHGRTPLDNCRLKGREAVARYLSQLPH